jgi:hypothetical protein
MRNPEHTSRDGTSETVFASSFCVLLLLEKVFSLDERILTRLGVIRAKQE